MATTSATQEVRRQDNYCWKEGRAMPPPLRSISSRMLGIIASSSAALRSEEEATNGSQNPSSSGTATASEICDNALRVSVHQDEEHHQIKTTAPRLQRHRRASSIFLTRSSQGEERRRSSLYSVGSTILSDLSSVADEMMSSLALETADTSCDLDQRTPTRQSTSPRDHTLLNARPRNDTQKEHGESPTATTPRSKSRRSGYHYPGIATSTASNRRSSCSSMLSTDSERSEVNYRHQVFLQTTRRRHSSLYDIDDDHASDDADGEEVNEEISHASDVEDIAIHRPGTSLAGNDAQESVRDLNFFEEGQFAVVDGLVTLSSSPINSVALRAG